MIGFFGGTFNPIHLGHLRLAEELQEALNLEQVCFIPSANPPFKPKPVVNAEHRAAMVKLAIADNPKFAIDTRELLRNGASYTIDTLISLRQELGNTQSIALLLGSDAFLGINRWHQWHKLLSHCHIVVTSRPKFKLESADEEVKALIAESITSDLTNLHNHAAGYIYLQSMTPLDVSASQIRAMYTNQQSARYLIPETVLNYIQDHQLYKP